MATGLKRMRVPEDMEPVLEEATSQPLIVEVRGQAYRISAEKVASVPYTLDNLYGSLPSLRGKNGPEISNDELEAIIKDAGRL